MAWSPSRRVPPSAGRVDAVQEAAHFKGNSLLTIELTSISRRGERIPVSTEPYSKAGRRPWQKHRRQDRRRSRRRSHPRRHLRRRQRRSHRSRSRRRYRCRNQRRHSRRTGADPVRKPRPVSPHQLHQRSGSALTEQTADRTIRRRRPPTLAANPGSNSCIHLDAVEAPISASWHRMRQQRCFNLRASRQ